MDLLCTYHGAEGGLSTLLQGGQSVLEGGGRPGGGIKDGASDSGGAE